MASYWIKSVRKNVNKSEGCHTFGLLKLAVSLGHSEKFVASKPGVTHARREEFFE